MFVNLETSDFREVLQGSDEKTWNAVAISFLERNDRNVAIGKLADAVLTLPRFNVHHFMQP